jgi:hypothetical protein
MRMALLDSGLPGNRSAMNFSMWLPRLVSGDGSANGSVATLRGGTYPNHPLVGLDVAMRSLTFPERTILAATAAARPHGLRPNQRNHL